MKEKKIALKIFALIGIFFVLIGTREIFHRIIWKKTEAEIDGISNANASHPTERASYVALISFKVEGQDYDGHINLGNSHRKSGETIKIWYNPNNPKEFVDEFSTGAAVGSIVMGMVFFVVGLQKFPNQRKDELVKEPLKEKAEKKTSPFTKELEHKTDFLSEEKNETANGLVNEIINLSEDELNVMRLMAKEKTITQDEIANRLHLSKSSVKRKISKLKEKEMIARVGADKNGYWKILK